MGSFWGFAGKWVSQWAPCRNWVRPFLRVQLRSLVWKTACCSGLSPGGGFLGFSLPGLGTKVTSLGQKLGASYVGDSYHGDGDMVHVNQKWLAADKVVCFSPPV